MTETWTHTMNAFCRYYTCANCPMRQGVLCVYNEWKIINGDDNK